MTYFFWVSKILERSWAFLVERADLIQHSGKIMEVVAERIQRADVVIGDISGSNPNVLYEIGQAHANNKQTILIMRAGGDIPFDLRAYNVLVYENVTQLR